MLDADMLGAKSLQVLINRCFAITAVEVFGINLDRIICIVTILNVRRFHRANRMKNEGYPPSRDRKLLYIPKIKTKPHSGLPSITQLADDFVVCAWRLYDLTNVRG